MRRDEGRVFELRTDFFPPTQVLSPAITCKSKYLIPNTSIPISPHVQLLSPANTQHLNTQYLNTLYPIPPGVVTCMPGWLKSFPRKEVEANPFLCYTHVKPYKY